jgi:hypothetical protein
MTHDFAMLCTIALKVLSRGKDKNQVSKLEDLIKRCRKLNDERISIVHGWWFVGGTPGSLIHSSRHQLKLNRYFKDVEDVVKQIDFQLARCT